MVQDDRNYRLGSDGFREANGRFWRGDFRGWLRSFDQGDEKPYPWLGTGGSAGAGFRSPLAIMVLGAFTGSLMLCGVYALVAAIVTRDITGLGILGALAGAALAALGAWFFLFMVYAGWQQHRWARANHVTYPISDYVALAAPLVIFVAFGLMALLS